MATGKPEPGRRVARHPARSAPFGGEEPPWGRPALRLALRQAETCLGGGAALVHRRDGDAGPLRLVAVGGLAPDAAAAWADLPEDADVAPARAVRSRGFVWTPGDGSRAGASGVAAVPLPGADGPIGALSVLTAGPGEPDHAQRSFLGLIAGWAAADLAGPSGAAHPGVPPREAPDAVTGTLRGLAEGFLTVSGDWRITFLNAEAERLLGPGPVPLGSVLWEVAAGRLPGLEERCRRAAAEGRPVSLPLRLPPGDRLYQVRCVPAPGSGLALSFAAAEQRQPEAAGLGTGERTTRMGELTEALAEAVTAKDVLDAVAARVLPPLGADGLGIEVLEGDRLHLVGLVGHPPGFSEWVDRRPVAANTPVADVLRTRTPLFLGSLAELVRGYPEMASVAVMSRKNAWVFLPLIASGRSIGCCVVSFSRPRSFSDEERTLLTALSGLVAQALERARLYDVEHARAQGLQRGLLPRHLPRAPAVRSAARYLPAGQGDQVGGDWYDVIPLSADRVAMVIGDVMGHGITEAATMGRLRTAVRTLAELEMPPDELFGHLNELVSDLGEDYYATCLYAVYDPVLQTCALSMAGHPPPVVVHPDGTAHVPDLAPNAPLGAAEPPFDTYQLHLPDRSLLVLCTDGLVESADRDLEQGLAELRRTLAGAMAGGSYAPAAEEDEDTGRLDGLCDAVVASLLPDHERTTDDAALLIARTRATPAGDVAAHDLPDDPRSAGQARAYVREQLAAWGLDDLVMTTELLVSELVGNAVRHASGPIRLRLLRSRSLVCEVYDGSLTTPRIRRASFTDEGGRGLHLIAALCTRWGARYLGEGKCIWTEQSLPGRD